MRTLTSPLIAIAVSAVLVSSSASTASADVGSWGTPVELSTADGDAYSPQLVTDGSRITAIWTRFDGSNVRIQATTSTDTSKTWSTPADVSTAGGDASSPQVVTDGRNITAIWQGIDGKNTRIQSATSTNAGTTWSNPADLSTADGDASSPQLVTDGSAITAVWSLYDGSINRIQAATSTDGGTSWSNPADLSTADGDASSPQLVTDGSTITAIWYRFDGSINRIQAATSTDVGDTWSTTPADVSTAGVNAYDPQLVTDGRTITAIWQRYDDGNFRIQAATSTDAGVTWSTTPADVSTAGGSASSPQLVTDGRTITAIWRRFDGSNYRIQAATSTDAGTTWSNPADLSTAGGNPYSPQLVTDGSTTIAIWQRNDGSSFRIQASSYTTPKLFTTTAVPAITGASKVGQTLTAHMTRWWTWSPTPTTLTYAWRRTVGGAVLGTDDTYVPKVADTGSTLFVTVTGKRAGYVNAEVVSTTTSAVAAGTFSITGTAQVGTVLNAATGTWPDGTTLTYSWKRSGVTKQISTAAEYTPVIADIAKTLTVTVTAKRTGASTISATSTATTAVLGQPFTTSPVPTISMAGAGTPVVGTKLTADPGTWGPGTSPTFSYVWRRAASPTGTKTVIPRATLKTYTAVAADKSMYITVTVTAKKSGFANTSVTSAEGGTRIGS